jgi:hypothetical protein
MQIEYNDEHNDSFYGIFITAPSFGTVLKASCEPISGGFLEIKSDLVPITCRVVPITSDFTGNYPAASRDYLPDLFLTRKLILP